MPLIREEDNLLLHPLIFLPSGPTSCPVCKTEDEWEKNSFFILFAWMGQFMSPFQILNRQPRVGFEHIQ
jgi:hypothetical protein